MLYFYIVQCIFMRVGMDGEIRGKTLKRPLRRADELAVCRKLAVSKGLEYQYCQNIRNIWVWNSCAHTYGKTYTHTHIQENHWALMFFSYCQVNHRGVVSCGSEPIVRQEGGGVSQPSLIKRTVRQRAEHNPGNLCLPRRKHHRPFDLEHSRTEHKYQH